MIPTNYAALVAAAALPLFVAGAASSEAMAGGSGSHSMEAAAPMDGQSYAPEVEDLQAMLQIRAPRGQGDNSTALVQWSSGVSGSVRSCIAESVMSPAMKTLRTSWEGKGKNPASICAVVPKPGAYYGIPGKNWFGYDVDMGTWYGKRLMNCTDERGGKCYARNLTNEYFRPYRTLYPGNFHTGQSWRDGKPTAVIEYALDALPNFHDELRPWCTCGVKVYLGLFFYFARGYQHSTPYPSSAFALVPPDAKDDDCPSISNMCDP